MSTKKEKCCDANEKTNGQWHSDECNYQNQNSKSLSLQKESEWEKAKEDVQWLIETVDKDSEFDVALTLTKIEVLFENAISNREKEIAEEVEKMKLPVPNPYGKWVKVERVNMLLNKVISIVKK